MWKSARALALGLAALATPIAASAHEVYVLSPEAVKTALTSPRFSEWQVVVTHLREFSFWALIAVLVVAGTFALSISKTLEKRFDPSLRHLKRYAPLVARVTGGLAFLACAYYGALFGPELPLTTLFGPWAGVARIGLALVGLMILAGVWVRIAALIVAGLFMIAAGSKGWYLLTYTNYVGEIILLVIGTWAVAERYRFLIMRVAFGISLIVAALYAKVIHNQLALAVATTPFAGHVQTLAATFGFEPHFLVLGAAIIEILAGIFFILGIEIRFVSLFLEFWLTLSLLYFGEIVWPHLILIGLPIALFCYGYDRYSLEGFFFKKGLREPVL